MSRKTRPLTNPAHPSAQAVGVADQRLAPVLADVLAACRRFYEAKRRMVFVEYVMLAGVNDRYEQAVQLARVLADALKQGKRVADSVTFYIQFGSQETRDYCIRKGYLDVFQKAGAHVIEPSCGACINAGPGVTTRPEQVVISAQNRNFPGRMGNKESKVFLASPYTVAGLHDPPHVLHRVCVMVRKDADGTMKVSREPIPEMRAELKQVIEEMG